MDKTPVPQKEIEVYKAELEKSERYSTTLVVKNDNDYAGALAEAKHIKDYLDIVTKRKESITQPLNAALKSARDLFKPLESMGENALAVVRAKMNAYYTDKEAKADKKINTIVDKYEAGKLSEGEANAKIMMATPDKTVNTSDGSATVRKVKKYTVVDKSKIPLDFLEPDMVRIKAAFKAGMPVPGIQEDLVNEIAIK